MKGRVTTVKCAHFKKYSLHDISGIEWSSPVLMQEICTSTYLLEGGGIGAICPIITPDSIYTNNMEITSNVQDRLF